MLRRMALPLSILALLAALATIAPVLIKVAQAQQCTDPALICTLKSLRPNYPTRMTEVQFGELLNTAVWKHRAEGFALLGKAGGNNCPTPAGVDISCDFIIKQVNGVWRGWDVLSDAGDGGLGNVTGLSGTGEDMTDAINSGARSVVQATGDGPVDPPGGTPGPPGPQGPKGDKGDSGDSADTGALTGRLNTLEAELEALKNRPVPTGCKATINLGFRIPVSCSLTF